VEEYAEVWAPAWLLGYVRQTLETAHAELMEALERRLGEMGRDAEAEGR